MFAGLFSASVASATEAFPVQAGTVEFRQVSKRYDNHPVLKQIDLKVHAGEVLAVCGPSGSGKSTLIRLINQLETVSGGEIYVDGKPTSSLTGKALRELRRHVGFVFQQFNLYAHLNALDNITLALTKVHGQPQREAEETALALLERVGLRDKAHHLPSQLSGGQQQRVAIARTLAAKPHIILFDEPTSALDPETIGEVLQVMRSLAHSGMTLIVVTHEMQFAREIADRVIFIDGGEILEQAAPEQFFTAPQHPRAQRFLQKVLNPLHAENREL